MAGSPANAARMLRKSESPPNSPVAKDVADFTEELAKNEENVEAAVSALMLKQGIFSADVVKHEIQHFFKGLKLHPIYFEHFTPTEIAKHIHSLIAAKHIADTTKDSGHLDIVFESEQSACFVTTIACPVPSEAQKRTEDKVSKHLTASLSEQESMVSLTFMASEGPAVEDGTARLGLYVTQQDILESPLHCTDSDTSLDVLASTRFRKEKTQQAKAQYHHVMQKIVASRRAVTRVVPGNVYPGPHPGGFVLLFGTSNTAGRHYFPEVCHAMRCVNLSPRRFYLETFANGVVIYSLFFPYAENKEVLQLERILMYLTHLKSFPNKSEKIYNMTMQAKVSPEMGAYLLAAVKFTHAFFPKERYASQYTPLLKVLENDLDGQQQLEALYKLCMKDLLCAERIYDLLRSHPELCVRFFNDFSRIAHGEASPSYNAELADAIDAACSDDQDRQILKMCLTFNESILLTNFFKNEVPGAFAFRLNPAIVLKNRAASSYPEVPYGIYLISGRDFLGFHVRFRDVARGGLRLIRSRDSTTYGKNYSTLFDECYNLALTQQYKNKDIPEGGSKGVILPDSSWPHATFGNILTGDSCQSPTNAQSCFVRFVDSLLDCMMPEASGIYSGHLGSPEILFFGPDENTAGYMDLGAELAKSRGYPYWKALTTGKGVTLGGVPHDVYGMTTASVHTYVTELLRELGENEEEITKFQTGGPDGDLGSNEILCSKDKTVGVVDGSGVLYDPAGLSRNELCRLASARLMVKEFSRSCLGRDGFLVTVEEVNISLPDGSCWATGTELRDNFHLTDYATADLFVPCGGRPNAVTVENVKRLFNSDRKPKFRMIVEGANLFFSLRAREVLENAGVHVFKDASTNKGGVTSSSCEVLAALALPDEDHTAMMTYDPTSGASAPDFYNSYVQDILAKVVENARLEFGAIWRCNTTGGIAKVEATQRLSRKVNQITDSIAATLTTMSKQESDALVSAVLEAAVPPQLLKRLGVSGVLQNVPPNYVGAIVASWVASRFVYEYGIDASEVSFFLFMRTLTGAKTKDSQKPLPEAGVVSPSSPLVQCR
mmetsp:Transcript_110286/g.235549  ORF Transcript_110286/g.235549 Transcript_110286/m.235549 type:complete len:1061 (+) Transcript_110286:91-3273(+)